MTDAKYQDLVTKNHNLIYHCIRKHGLDESEYYDLLAIALCNAARTFQEGGGAGFAQYAMVCMENAIRREFEYNRYQCRDVSLKESLTDYEDENGNDDKTLIMQNSQNVAQTVIMRDMIERGYRRCVGKQRRIFSLVVRGYTQQEIADRMGVTHQCVQSQVVRIRKKLAQEIV